MKTPISKAEFADIAVYLHNLPIIEKCDGKSFHYTKRYIHRNLPHLNIKNVLEYLRHNGAYCDCEILLNLTFMIFSSEEEYNKFWDTADKKRKEKEQIYKEKQRQKSKDLFQQDVRLIQKWLINHPNIIKELQNMIPKNPNNLKVIRKWMRQNIAKQICPNCKTTNRLSPKAVMQALSNIEQNNL